MSYVGFGAPRPFNGSSTGGDSVSANLNQWYQAGDQGFVLICSFLVLLMVPAVGLLYSGLCRRTSALSLLWVCMMAYTVMIAQWFLVGYSLAFSDTAANGFIGDLRYACLRGVLAQPSPGSPLVPALLYAFFQFQFCAVTGAIVVGSVAERGRVGPAMVFIFVWTTVVYCPLAYWVWGTNGWGLRWGVLDFAGGTPVEIGSGFSALAYAWVLGTRDGGRSAIGHGQAHNVSLVVLATALLWFGWLGFNGGSALGANLRAVVACWNSCLTAMFAAAVWSLLDYRLTGKWSMVGWCAGAIAGLVAATPACGYIDPWASIILGIVAGLGCNLATKVKTLLGIDDAVDALAAHGFGGIIGLMANGFFARNEITALDGVSNRVVGGFLDGNYSLLYKQLAVALAAAAYAFAVSAVVAKLVDCLPGLHLRASAEAERVGIDNDQHAESAYDYVELRCDCHHPACPPTTTTAAPAAPVVTDTTADNPDPNGDPEKASGQSEPTSRFSEVPSAVSVPSPNAQSPGSYSQRQSGLRESLIQLLKLSDGTDLGRDQRQHTPRMTYGARFRSFSLGSHLSLSRKGPA